MYSCILVFSAVYVLIIISYKMSFETFKKLIKSKCKGRALLSRAYGVDSDIPV